MSEGFSYRLCGNCGAPYRESVSCPSCSATLPIQVIDGYISVFPAATMSCAGCGSDEKPTKFRGWSRLLSFFIWARETRMAAYVCEDCNRKEAAKALMITSLVGWLSFPSWFFYGWRTTYFNWRSVWAAPRRPHEWGAMSAHEFTEAMQAAQEEAFAEVEEWVVQQSPLGSLDEMQQRLVLSADDLYELLDVAPDASTDDIRAAYRRRSKEAHPDLRHGVGSADEMIRLNQAWEVLRDRQMREAYDWVDANLERAA